MQSESEEEEEEEETSEEETSEEEEDEEDEEEREIRGISDEESYSGDDSFEGDSDSGDESSYEEVHESRMGFLSKNRSNNRKKSYSTTKPTNFTPKIGLFNKKEGEKKQKKPLATTTTEKSKGRKLFGKKTSKKQVLHQKPVVGKKLSKAMQPGNQKNPFGVKKVATANTEDQKTKGKNGKKIKKGKDLLSSSSKSSLNKKLSSNSLSASKSPKTLKPPATGLPPVGESFVVADPKIKRLPNETEEKVYDNKVVKQATYSGEPPSGLPLDNVDVELTPKTENVDSNIPSQSNNLVEKPQHATNDASTKDVETNAYPQTLNPNGVESKQLPAGRFISAQDFRSSSSVDIPGGLPTSAQPQIIGYYLFSNPGTTIKEGSPIDELQNSKESTAMICGDNLMVSTPEGNNYSFKTKPFYSSELSGTEIPSQPEQLNKTSTVYSSESNNITRNIISDESNNSSPLMTNSNEMKYVAKFQPTVVPTNDNQNLTLDTAPQTNSTTYTSLISGSTPMNDGFTTPTSTTTPKPIGGNTLGSESQGAAPARIVSTPLVSTTEAKIAAMKAKGVKRLPREANGAFGKRGKDDPTVPRSYKKGMPKMKMGGMFGGKRPTKSRKETKKMMNEKEKRRSKIRDSIVTSFT
ncbi:hypothetical protein C6P45_000468 [Maudiozyma exigua]|uniref:Uncharacterized protein n=1 Tax=Maudiozyma exigua TaxID=34358 RepID=A0A9P7B8X3_MAUEX|nr:hypothetical protein C6P45_000468 [Kazachstania exigua]